MLPHRHPAATSTRTLNYLPYPSIARCLLLPQLAPAQLSFTTSTRTLHSLPYPRHRALPPPAATCSRAAIIHYLHTYSALSALPFHRALPPPLATTCSLPCAAIIDYLHRALPYPRSCHSLFLHTYTTCTLRTEARAHSSCLGITSKMESAPPIIF